MKKDIIGAFIVLWLTVFTSVSAILAALKIFGVI